MNRRWIAIAVAAFAVAAASFGALRLRVPEVQAIEVQAAPLVRTLRFSARVATLSRVDVGSTVTGRVTEVRVDEGAAVKRGDVLIRLESDELNAALAQAVAAERQAQARLQGVRSTGRTSALAALEQAEANLHAAELDLKRQQQLVSQGFVSASRVDDARRALDVAQAQRQAARAQTQAVADSGTDVIQAQAQLETARAATRVARARLAQTLVAAPADAKVLTRQVEPGQIVQPGKALLSLALAGPTQLVAPVDERFLDQLQTGQPALVIADAFPDQPFPARVLTIAPAIDAQRGAVEVKLALERQPPPFLREDMTLSVDVETGRRERALVVPLTAVRPAPGGRDAVLVVDGGRTRERPVRLGLRTLDAVEVVEGLAAGDRVLMRADREPGKSVRVTLVPWRPGLGSAPAGTPEDPGSTLGNAFGR